MKEKLHYEVSFEIDLVNDTEDLSMQPREIKENIKFWLENQFQDYFDKFKIKKLQCKKQ